MSVRTRSNGVIRSNDDGEVRWSGYTYAGDSAVYGFGNASHDLVREFLASADAG